MSTKTAKDLQKMKVSRMAENLIGSEILKLSADINKKIQAGEKIFNMTVGDFNPNIFPIPADLKEEIIKAYQNDHTNYPPASGIPDLLNAVSHYLQKNLGLNYTSEEILIAGGARPLIYGIYQALIDQEDTVLYPVPSWNNNHYCHISNCNQVFIETKPENNFMPTAIELMPHLKEAQMLALCSPLNPTGTTFTEQGLREICELVIEENNRRSEEEKPLYILYDQIYWTLTYGDTKHVDPVSLYPELKDYTIFVDGLSKSFAATGVRVGWSFGPKRVIDKMKSILGHLGAWAPKAEQVATANYLKMDASIDHYLLNFKKEIEDRLLGLYKGILKLKESGFQVDAIAPQAAMYLTVKFELIGKTTPEGKIISKMSEVTNYLLDEAKIGLVPFSAFGASEQSSWYRISVGTCKIEDIDHILTNIQNALLKLK